MLLGSDSARAVWTVDRGNRAQIESERTRTETLDWRAGVGARNDQERSVDLERAREPGRGRSSTRPNKSHLAGGETSCGGYFGQFRRTVSCPLLAASRSSRFSQCSQQSPPSYRYMDFSPTSSTIGKHLSLLSGFLPGGVLQLIADQVTLISRQANETLGVAFVAGLLIVFGSANSGMAALFDALNVVYDEREKRSLARFYATTFLFTIAGIAFIILAIMGVVAVPLILKFVGLASTTERLLTILRWPILLAVIMVGLASSIASARAAGMLAGVGLHGGASWGRCFGLPFRCCFLGTLPRSTATTEFMAHSEPVSD